MKIRRWIVRGAFAAAVVGLVGAGAGAWWYLQSSLLDVFSSPSKFTRRQGDFTVNVCGMTSRAYKLGGTRLQYRLNGGRWKDINQDYTSTHSRHFRIELAHGTLRKGSNELEIVAEAWLLGAERLELPLEYDPSPIELPIHEEWSDSTLQVEAGAWERIKREGRWHVRPRIGHEGYDRILIAAGAFSGGRRIETELVFRYAVKDRPHAFGILPMWGGRPDDPGVRPRRGWNFSLVWWWSRYEGYGSEFSYRHGEGSPEWVNSYRNFEVEPGVRYRVVVEAWPEVDPGGRHLRYRQRAKWWKAGEPEPEHWVEIADDQGAPLPQGEYGVGLVAYWSQVEFGPVTILPMEPRTVPGGRSPAPVAESRGPSP
jgi:hypothetical protein